MSALHHVHQASWLVRTLHPFFHLKTPFDPLHGDGYQVWSGVLGSTAIFSLAWTQARRHNCHRKWCFRLGRFALGDTPFVLCPRHRWDGKSTADQHVPSVDCDHVD